MDSGVAVELIATQSELAALVAAARRGEDGDGLRVTEGWRARAGGRRAARAARRPPASQRRAGSVAPGVGGLIGVRCPGGRELEVPRHLPERPSRRLHRGRGAGEPGREVEPAAPSTATSSHSWPRRSGRTATSFSGSWRRWMSARTTPKSAGAWTAEKFGRLKPNGQLTGYSPLSRLVELEGLKLGITGKLGLWTQPAGSRPRGAAPRRRGARPSRASAPATSGTGWRTIGCAPRTKRCAS